MGETNRVREERERGLSNSIHDQKARRKKEKTSKQGIKQRLHLTKKLSLTLSSATKSRAGDKKEISPGETFSSVETIREARFASSIRNCPFLLFPLSRMFDLYSISNSETWTACERRISNLSEPKILAGAV